MSTNTYSYDYDQIGNRKSAVSDQMSEVSTNFYVWGLDLSGSLQGAGGIGGLLSVIEGGTSSPSESFFPAYDANGNITEYTDTNGTIVAHYEYDPFGGTIASSGTKADDFKFRFSTKYFDVETGLYYYGYRYYSTDLGRWINRDPIEEDGGVNVYGFVGNEPISKRDYLGWYKTPPHPPYYENYHCPFVSNRPFPDECCEPKSMDDHSSDDILVDISIPADGSDPWGHTPMIRLEYHMICEYFVEKVCLSDSQAYYKYTLYIEIKMWIKRQDPPFPL